MSLPCAMACTKREPTFVPPLVETSQVTKAKPALHPEVQQLLTLMAENPPPPYETLTPDQAREMARAFVPEGGMEIAIRAVEDILIAIPSGTMAARIYHPPLETEQDNAARPGVLFFHGGGWVICDLDTHDDLCRRLCASMGAIVLSVDYRLSPETAFPGAVEDCAAALDWFHAHARALAIAPDQIFVAGDSAGGNLAAVTAIDAKSRNAPPLAGEILFYPVTDLSSEHPSYATASPTLPLTSSAMRWFRSHYLRPRNDGSDWRASPLRAENLEGLPPTYVLTVEHDPLRDEGIAYARKLAMSGVEVTHTHLSNQFHGFLSLAAILSDGPATIAMVAAWARSILKRHTPA